MIDRLKKPALVALYDIRPGNGASLFLQPQSPHEGRGGAISDSQLDWSLGCLQAIHPSEWSLLSLCSSLVGSWA